MKRLPMAFGIELTTACIPWPQSTGSHGYGQTFRSGKNVLAYKALWEDENGPIPENHELDHKCHNRRCVNLDHLSLVPMPENRGWRTHLTTCPKGHPYSGDNLYVAPNRDRRCRTCANQRRRKL